MTLTALLLLIAAVAATAFLMYTASSLVLRRTLSEQLVDTVEENAGMLQLRNEATEGRNTYSLSLGDRYLEIDRDFLRRLGGVYAALYTREGEFLYGEDPIAGRIETDFTATRLHRLLFPRPPEKKTN